MFTLREDVIVRAPIHRCFLLSTSVAIVKTELRMTPTSGKTSGHVQGGDRIRWEGWKFGLPHAHESLIDRFEPDRFFEDRMIAGRFAHFHHTHAFLDRQDGTVLLRDELQFEMPYGWAGRLVGRCLLLPYIRKLMRRRFALIKRIAEGDEWRKYLSPDSSA